MGQSTETIRGREKYIYTSYSMKRCLDEVSNLGSHLLPSGSHFIDRMYVGDGYS